MPATNGVETLLPPPEGYIVDFEHPQRTYLTQICGVTGGGLIIMWFFVLQNLYIRWYIQRRWGDAPTICLLVAAVTSTATQISTLSWFMMPVVGLHVWELPVTQLVFFLKAFTIQAALFNIVTLFAKMAIVLYYRQLSPQRWWRWAVNGTGVVVLGYCISLTFATVLGCKPVAKAWDVTMTEGYCIDKLSMFIATAAMGIVTDLILLCLPLHLVLGLQMRTYHKLGLILVFTIGSATFVTSIVRLSLLLQPTFSSADTTWDMCLTIVWAIVEIQLLVICPSMCTLRAFARHALRLGGSESYARNSSSAAGGASGGGYGGTGSHHKNGRRSALRTWGQRTERGGDGDDDSETGAGDGRYAMADEAGRFHFRLRDDDARRRFGAGAEPAAAAVVAMETISAAEEGRAKSGRDTKEAGSGGLGVAIVGGGDSRRNSEVSAETLSHNRTWDPRSGGDEDMEAGPIIIINSNKKGTSDAHAHAAAAAPVVGRGGQHLSAGPGQAS